MIRRPAIAGDGDRERGGLSNCNVSKVAPVPFGPSVTQSFHGSPDQNAGPALMRPTTSVVVAMAARRTAARSGKSHRQGSER